MVDGFALRTSSFELPTTSQPIRLKIPRGAIENRNTPGTRHSAFCMSTTLIKTLILPPHIFSLKMLMSLVRAFTAVVYRSPGSRCVPHLVPCTIAMAHRRLATLCSHMSAGTDSTRRLPDTPKMSTFKCANGLDIFTKVSTWAHSRVGLMREKGHSRWKVGMLLWASVQTRLTSHLQSGPFS